GSARCSTLFASTTLFRSVVAGGDDEVLDTVDQIEVAVLVHDGDVTSPEETIHHVMGRLFRLAPITPHHLRPAHAQLTTLTHRDRSEEHTSELQSRENLVC